MTLQSYFYHDEFDSLAQKNSGILKTRDINLYVKLKQEKTVSFYFSFSIFCYYRASLYYDILILYTTVIVTRREWVRVRENERNAWCNYENTWHAAVRERERKRKTPMRTIGEIVTYRPHIVDTGCIHDNRIVSFNVTRKKQARESGEKRGRENQTKEKNSVNIIINISDTDFSRTHEINIYPGGWDRWCWTTKINSHRKVNSRRQIAGKDVRRCYVSLHMWW